MSNLLIKNNENQDLISEIKHLEQDFILLIRNRLGIIIHTYQIKDMHNVILRACKKFNCSPTAYLQTLKTCPQNSSTLEHLIAGVTIGETYFFRDKSQMNLLEKKILPMLIKNKREKKDLSLRIWSAGSASGEEIYTIAMLLLKLVPDLSQWTLHLLGTDINTQSLKKAIAGKYTEWSMRAIPEEYKKNYFIYEPPFYSLKDKIRDLVSFAYLNLNDNFYPSIFNDTNANDLILCRNVLIYFDREHTGSLMKKFSASLIEGGYLILGASDPINTSGTDFIFHYKDGIVFSRKTKTEIASVHAEKKASLAIKHIPFSLKKTVPQTPSLVKKSDSSPEKLNLGELKSNIQIWTSQSAWQKIIDCLDQYTELNQDAFFLTTKAMAFANLGKLKEAVYYSEKSLAINNTDPLSHFTYGMALVELNQLQAAEAALRKAIYLDHEFVLGHFQLGLLLLRNKNLNGLKSLQNALNIVKTKDPTVAVQGFHDLTYGRLTEIFTHEIEIHGQVRGENHA